MKTASGVSTSQQIQQMSGSSTGVTGATAGTALSIAADILLEEPFG